MVETMDVKLDERRAAAIECDAPLPPGPYLVLKVSDTGTGIDPEDITRIFEPFYTTKPQGRGTGLGLATVYGIVKQHGGHIRVGSSPGEGAVFEIYLPPAKDEVERTSPREEAPPLTGRECVLLVEDDDPVRYVTRKILEKHGYKVIDCGDITQAMELFRKNEDDIELLLADIIMPGGDGAELCNALRLYKPELKVLFLSGYPDESPARIRDSAFLRKPFTDVELLKELRGLLNGENA